MTKISTKISVDKRDIINLARAYYEKDLFPEAMFKETIENLIRVFRKNGDEGIADYLNMMIDETDRAVPMDF